MASRHPLFQVAPLTVLGLHNAQIQTSPKTGLSLYFLRAKRDDKHQEQTRACDQPGVGITVRRSLQKRLRVDAKR